MPLAEDPFGLFAGPGAYEELPCDAPSCQHGYLVDVSEQRYRKDEGERAVLLQEPARKVENIFVSQCDRVSGCAASRIGRQQVVEIGRVGEYRGIPCVGMAGKLYEVGLFYRDALFPGRGLAVFPRLLCRVGVYLYSCYGGVAGALGCHYGKDAGPRANVEDVACVSERSPCPQQYAVGAYFHGAVFLAYCELLEVEYICRHSVVSRGMWCKNT